jgi:hypothetical protein
LVLFKLKTIIIIIIILYSPKTLGLVWFNRGGGEVRGWIFKEGRRDKI